MSIKLETLTFIWKIECYSEVLRQAKAGEKKKIESIPFYTGRTERCGYKLRVWMFPNGDRVSGNAHLCVCIVLMKGEYDTILPWPFKKRVTFTLIDQQGNPVERENVAKYFVAGDHPECFAKAYGKQGQYCKRVSKVCLSRETSFTALHCR